MGMIYTNGVLCYGTETIENVPRASCGEDPTHGTTSGPNLTMLINT
jgi:hypothetical protein